MKQTILALTFALSAFMLPGVAFAQTNLEPGVCVSVYGGGVVCGAKHEVVPTALGDVNPAILGAGFLFASGVFVYLSNRMKRPSVEKRNSSQVLG